MAEGECPQCGGGLQLEVRGKLLDKIKVCRHCGYERDVLDEVTIEGDGVTIHRKDLGGDQAMAAMGDMDDLVPKLESMVGADIAAQVKDQLAQGQASGKFISHTSRTTTVHRGDEAAKMISEMGIDLDAIVADSLKQARESAPETQSQPNRALRAMLLIFALILLLTGGVVAVLFLF